MRFPGILALLAALLAPMQVHAQDNLNTPERLDTFRKLDTDGDGWLSKAEAAARREVAAGFSKADANRDGRLSYAEFETIPLSRGG
jgi:Ca2+-binding EF-hand superfamily protein